jgi:hypothetical protein
MLSWRMALRDMSDAMFITLYIWIDIVTFIAVNTQKARWVIYNAPLRSVSCPPNRSYLHAIFIRSPLSTSFAIEPLISPTVFSLLFDLPFSSLTPGRLAPHASPAPTNTLCPSMAPWLTKHLSNAPAKSVVPCSSITRLCPNANPAPRPNR